MRICPLPGVLYVDAMTYIGEYMRRTRISPSWLATQALWLGHVRRHSTVWLASIVEHARRLRLPRSVAMCCNPGRDGARLHASVARGLGIAATWSSARVS
jgi:hypothetical protein